MAIFKKLILETLKKILRFCIRPLSRALATSGLFDDLKVWLDLHDIFNHTFNHNPLFTPNYIADECAQRALVANWSIMKHHKMPVLSFDEAGFRAFSQFNEDGILLYIYTMIGVKNHLAVEIGANCVGSTVGIPQTNTTNLVVNHGWNALIIDGDDRNVEKIRGFYKRCCNTIVDRISPKVIHQFITIDNVNSIISSHGFNGDIDLLSIDIDGMDYWIWKAINVINPRVVVVEFAYQWRSDDAVTIPYKENYVWDMTDPDSVEFDYCGTSLPALVKLGREKGYRLVGVNKFRHNAFFIRNDIGLDYFPEVDPKVRLSSPYTDIEQLPLYPKSKDWKWTSV